MDSPVDVGPNIAAIVLGVVSTVQAVLIARYQHNARRTRRRVTNGEKSDG